MISAAARSCKRAPIRVGEVVCDELRLLKRDRQPLGNYARHYYDLYQLSREPKVIAMLKSDQYADIKKDYDLVSRTYFAKSYFPPDEMSFARSDALFPVPELAATIGAEYEEQCRKLCYRPYPTWLEAQARFLEIRELLWSVLVGR